MDEFGDDDLVNWLNVDLPFSTLLVILVGSLVWALFIVSLHIIHTALFH